MPRVSILLPARNAAATLPATLRSIARQGFPDWELVAVDDRSDDATRDVLARAAERDRRIRVLAAAGRGLVDALVQAAVEARGNLLARMDADDVMHPERLELQVAGMDGVDVLATRVRIAGPSAEGMRRYVRWQNGLTSHEELVANLFIESPLTHPSVMLRREAFERAGGYRDPGWAEDFDLWHRLRETGARFAKLPRVLLAWRDGPGRLTRTHPMYSAKAFHAARVHYFRRHPWARRPVTLWGAGPTGRAWARDLLAAGVEVEAAIDIDPRKIGRRLANGRVPVVDVETGLSRRRGPVLGVVGSRGARDLIRARLVEAGVREHLFLC
jgi:glycosyltransferase involved in cell wall biosynthesis